METRPNPSEFNRLVQDAAVVPVWRDVVCDADTPVGLYARLRHNFGPEETTFLLESVVGQERWARYSFIGVGARAHLSGRFTPDGLAVEVRPGTGMDLISSIPTQGGEEVLRAYMQAMRGPEVDGLPRFWGGLVGVWGHDTVRCFERLPQPTGRVQSGLPAMELVATDTLIVFDNLSQRVSIVATAVPEADGGSEAAYAKAVERIARVEAALAEPGPRLAPLSLPASVPSEVAQPAAPWSREKHLAAVERAREYIVEGDIFQVVLSQRFDVPRGDVDPLDVYRVLRVTNPAPYMYILELPSATLVGASPEVLVRVDHGGNSRRVTVRPIAGTRPRGRDAAEDRALEEELLADPKERAEHLMLIDLGRNDVGRVSRPGSVRMEDSFCIERYSRVMHIVSEVSGELLPDLDAFDALRATFPAGTLSGAPKVRALEIIDELEPAERGWYGGAVGYVGYDGGADFAICIRSLVATEDSFRVQAGGGIVYDSDPETEDQECRNKASAVVRAIAMARLATEEGAS